jgi:hypothetical protein
MLTSFTGMCFREQTIVHCIYNTICRAKYIILVNILCSLYKNTQVRIVACGLLFLINLLVKSLSEERTF